MTLAGTYEHAIVELGGGDDTLRGRNGTHRVDAGADDDRVTTGTGADRIVGGSGGDAIDGGTGNDAIEAGKGNDTLDGGAGADSLAAGAGDDAVLFGADGAAVTLYGITAITTADTQLAGGRGTDTLRGTAANDAVDLRDARYRGPTGEFEVIDLGDGDDLLIGAAGTRITVQTAFLGGGGGDVLSGFGVRAPAIDLRDVDTDYDARTGVWTIDYGRGANQQTVHLTSTQVRDADTWNPDANLQTLFAGARFTELQYFDGGPGHNPRIEGTEGADIVFGGAANPAPDGDYDDFIYGGRGDDILIGGDEYDVYHFAPGWGDDLIIDGNGRAGAYANGLVVFQGFDSAGRIDIARDGITPRDVAFTDNADGTMTLSFNGASGMITFAPWEISEITLYRHTDPVGAPATVSSYAYDVAGNDYDLMP